jgi:hypothetical protein
MVENDDIERSNPQLEKMVKIILIAGILIIIPFIFGVSLRRDPPYTIWGVLNDEMEAGNYPTTIQTNENISLFLFVECHKYGTINVGIRHIVGVNSSLELNSEGTVGGTLVQEINFTAQDAVRWESTQINSTIATPLGANEHFIIAFELWLELNLIWTFHDLLYIRLNTTA